MIEVVAFLLFGGTFLVNTVCGSMEVQVPPEYVMTGMEILQRKPVYDPKAAKITKYQQGWGVGHRAQYKEDLYLYERYFFGMVNGTIMESGALDGNRLSTTYMFETYFNWFPVHVEASFQHYALLKQNRPNGLNVHAALCNESRILHFLHRENGSAVDGILEFMEPQFVSRFHKYWHRTKDPRLLHEMQCVTAPFLFQFLHIIHLDIWVLDVEGAELAVLSVIEWSTAPTIDVILLEIMRRNDRSGQADKTIEILEKNGYQCHPYMSNAVCVHGRLEMKRSIKPGLDVTKTPKSMYHGT